MFNHPGTPAEIAKAAREVGAAQVAFPPEVPTMDVQSSSEESSGDDSSDSGSEAANVLAVGQHIRAEKGAAPDDDHDSAASTLYLEPGTLAAHPPELADALPAISDRKQGHAKPPVKMVEVSSAKKELLARAVASAVAIVRGEACKDVIDDAVKVPVDDGTKQAVTKPKRPPSEYNLFVQAWLKNPVNGVGENKQQRWSMAAEAWRATKPFTHKKGDKKQSVVQDLTDGQGDVSSGAPTSTSTGGPAASGTQEASERAPTATFGCSKCRMQTSGCLKCNPAKAVKYAEKLKPKAKSQTKTKPKAKPKK